MNDDQWETHTQIYHGSGKTTFTMSGFKDGYHVTTTKHPDGVIEIRKVPVELVSVGLAKNEVKDD
jgi:hypothetical protein